MLAEQALGKPNRLLADVKHQLVAFPAKCGVWRRRDVAEARLVVQRLPASRGKIAILPQAEIDVVPIKIAEALSSRSVHHLGGCTAPPLKKSEEPIQCLSVGAKRRGILFLGNGEYHLFPRGLNRDAITGVRLQPSDALTADVLEEFAVGAGRIDRVFGACRCSE